MMLLDTSIWVDLLGCAPRTRISDRDQNFVVTCPPVIQEVLQGIRDDLVHQRVREGMLALPCLSATVESDLYLEGADLYRAGRRRGITLRTGVDCLIAAIAIRHGAEVAHIDRDFDALATFSNLRVRRLM